MKKIIAITLVLLIGLFMLGGCGSSDVQQTTEQEEGTNPEPQGSPSRTGSAVPQPPPLPED